MRKVADEMDQDEQQTDEGDKSKHDSATDVHK